MPLSPSETRTLLGQLGHHPVRALGQNFLVDGNIVRKSLDLAQIAPGDRVVEIGPGLGTLTRALLAAGTELWAVERDPRLHAHLVATLVPEFPATFHLLHGDAMDEPLAGLVPGGELPTVTAPALAPTPASPTVTAPTASPDAHAPALSTSDTAAVAGLATAGAAPDFKIVANLPYAISTPWMDAVLSGPLPARMVLMLQREAADRYVAHHGSKAFGAISIFLQAAFAPAPGHAVAAACFHPRPDVDSYLLHLVRRAAPYVFPAPARALIRGCFQQRRKQIGALVRERLPEGGAAWLATLSSHGLDARARPEDIPLPAWRQLAESLPPAA